MIDLVRGVFTSPWIVGLARGVLHAAISAGLLFLTAALSGSDVPAALVPFVPVLIAALRGLEGVVDQLDPAKPS